MALLHPTPTHPTPTHPRRHPGTSPGPTRHRGPDDRPVLVLTDLDRPDVSVLRHAVSTAEALDAPLSLVLLYDRPGFTTDAALALARHRRLNRRQDEVVRTVHALLAERGLDPRLVAARVPYPRLPLGSAADRAVRAARAVTRSHPSLLVVADAALQENARPCADGNTPRGVR